MLFNVLKCRIIHGEDTVLAACLYGHIGDREPVIHREVADTVTGELHGFIQCSVHAYHADDMEDHILAADIRRFFTGDIEPDRSGNLEPGLSCSHTGSHIRGSHTCRESTQCSVSTCMRVCTYDHITGHCQSFFG